MDAASSPASPGWRSCAPTSRSCATAASTCRGCVSTGESTGTYSWGTPGPPCLGCGYGGTHMPWVLCVMSAGPRLTPLRVRRSATMHRDAPRCCTLQPTLHRLATIARCKLPQHSGPVLERRTMGLYVCMYVPIWRKPGLRAGHPCDSHLRRRLPALQGSSTLACPQAPA